MEKVNPRVYYDEAYPPVPSGGTRFWRKFPIWQLFRFLILNWKVMKIVAFGHS
jgi:hypothetical protein